MRYSILIVAFLMFNLTGYSQTTSGQEDRIYWVNILSQIADPLLNSMSKGELKKNMPIETIRPLLAFAPAALHAPSAPTPGKVSRPHPRRPRGTALPPWRTTIPSKTVRRRRRASGLRPSGPCTASSSLRLPSVSLLRYCILALWLYRISKRRKVRMSTYRYSDMSRC